MIDEKFENLKKVTEEAVVAGGQAAADTKVTISAETVLDLVRRLEEFEQRIVWLERKKRTIADLASAAHNWAQAKLELADKRILHIEEVLDNGQGVYTGLSDETEFKRGYRAALYWFRSEILEDPNFAEQKKAADARKG